MSSLALRFLAKPQGISISRQHAKLNIFLKIAKIQSKAGDRKSSQFL